MKTRPDVRIGIYGWRYEPWRGVFYPKGLTQAKELSYAATQLTSIEINGTYYGSQKPESFRKWASEVPNGFIFSVKGPRFATNRRVLAEAGDSIQRFFDSARQKEEGCASFHDQRLALIVSQHKSRSMIRRIVAPPPFP